MPGGDRTGPMGMGPRSGRGMSFCVGYDAPGYANPAPGRGMGMGMGRGGGRGRRNMFYATGQPGWMRFNPGYATSAADPEIEALAQQMQALQNQLDQIQKQLVNLSAKPKED